MTLINFIFKIKLPSHCLRGNLVNNNKNFPIKKVLEIFAAHSSKNELEELEKEGIIEKAKRFRAGAIVKKGWGLDSLPKIGEQIGFFPKFSQPISMAVFTTKGGVLKSTLALNIARVAALHNVKTCVVGLDIQGDVTTALGFENDLEDTDDLPLIIDRLNNTKGLADLFNGQTRIDDIIQPTDLSKLFLIPETPELVAMNDSLGNIHRREFWIKEKVIDKLKKDFDLVIMDCSPNWNQLTTNALVGCDVLISPLECKINNFRNFKVFRHFLREFQEEMKLNFQTIFVPTRFSINRKLSLEIRSWYENNVEGCTHCGLRESVLGEEATALYSSVVEHAPGKVPAIEMQDLLREVHRIVQEVLNERTENLYYSMNGVFNQSEKNNQAFVREFR